VYATLAHAERFPEEDHILLVGLVVAELGCGRVATAGIERAGLGKRWQPRGLSQHEPLALGTERQFQRAYQRRAVSLALQPRSSSDTRCRRWRAGR
jgi:hypothetical protein